MTATAADLLVDERTLLQFVVWNLRVRDLPRPVRDAAARVAAARRHPRPGPAGHDPEYVDAPFRVAAIPQHDDARVIDCSGCGASVPELVADLLECGPKYVLVTDLRDDSDRAA